MIHMPASVNEAADSSTPPAGADHPPGRPPGYAPARAQRGAVSVITGLVVLVMVGFLGLAVDLGRLFVVKTELQTAMDACALAASTRLRPGLVDPATLDRAVAFGRTPPNRLLFQSQQIDPAAIEFAFATNLGGPYTVFDGSGNPQLAAAARYVRCSYRLADVPVYFMRVLSAIDGAEVGATAVATLSSSQTNCAVPTALCRASAATGPAFGLVPGQWIGALGDAGKGGGPTGCTSGTGSGNFCWLDYTPPGGGASELADLIRGGGQCELTIDSQVGQTGLIASLASAWNTRFGIYKAQEIQRGDDGDMKSAPPDFSGYSYTPATWPQQAGAFSDFISRRAARAAFNLTADEFKLPGGHQPISTALHGQYGRDRRIALAPIMDCSRFGTQQVAPIDAWACVLLLAPIGTPGSAGAAAQLEYLGRADSPNSPCASTGLAGGSSGPLVSVLVQ